MRSRTLLWRVAGIAVVALTAFVASQAVRRPPLHAEQAKRRLERHAASRRVVLVSIGGLAPRVMAATPTPTLDRLVREGAATDVARTVSPPMTIAANTTMITGRRPDGPDGHGHGRKPKEDGGQRWSAIPEPTIYSRCDDEGLRCALISQRDDFAHFAADERGVDYYVRSDETDWLLDEGASWMRREEGDFLMVYLADVDRVGHKDGWDSQEQRAVVTEIDAHLGAFLEALERDPRPLTLLVVADHGGEGHRHDLSIDANILVPFVLFGDGISPATSLGADVSVMDVAPTVLSALGLPAPVPWAGRSRYLEQSQIAAPLH